MRSEERRVGKERIERWELGWCAVMNWGEDQCFFQAEDGIRDADVTGVQTCALPIWAKDMEWQHALIAAFGSTCRVGSRPEDDANIRALLDAATPVCTVVGKTWTLHVKDEIGRASCRERAYRAVGAGLVRGNELGRGSVFFSSRRRHTRCGRDWSSDVCSSDLGEGHGVAARADRGFRLDVSRRLPARGRRQHPRPAGRSYAGLHGGRQDVDATREG